ncbi:MAG: transcription antitermination factor NusB [Betaproteobacteria bacterium]|nr:transcription antitermination factor NusB [Betaproteobacteria bacterium]NBT10597.1 transcription antitermination factor NusB [Betaproteobacteria bacterium]NBU48578.1 transcription antitermination factor NusB [Betaproteobacteria bacterium]
MSTPKASPRRSAASSARRRARQAALTGLYQWLISGEEPSVIQVNVEEQDVHAGCDRAHFESLLHGCIGQAAQLDAALTRHVDRPTADLSPVEHAALMIGAYELSHCIEIPYRVVINEAVELTKAFGGTDGHKYVNGVLDKTAADLRPLEVQAGKAGRS